jgi:hypothetical protein
MFFLCVTFSFTIIVESSDDCYGNKIIMHADLLLDIYIQLNYPFNVAFRLAFFIHGLVIDFSLNCFTILVESSDDCYGNKIIMHAYLLLDIYFN